MKTAKPKIVIDQHIPYIQGALEPFAQVEYLGGKEISAQDMSDASALIVRTRTICDAALLKGSKVKIIASATIGYDHIDTEYCESNGIEWANAPGCNSGSVAQYITAALLQICKKEEVHPSKLTLGVVGIGNVGSKVVKIARSLGFKVLKNDPPRAREEGDDKFVSLNRIARKCDIITFHVPRINEGPDKTYHLFDNKFLEKLEKKPYIINTSRGEVADTEALKTGAKKGLVRGLILDVWENEPEIDSELLGLTMISTPHIAGYSADGKANGTAMAVANVARVLKFDLNNWFPTAVPIPELNVIKMNAAKYTLIDAVKKAVDFTYDLKAESKKLANNIGDFEKLRNNYPLRREFGSFEVVLKNGSKSLVQLFTDLGFHLKH